ncbi:MAG: c-type cytochrome domain-containing protein [Pirellulales bacterium]
MGMMIERILASRQAISRRMGSLAVAGLLVASGVAIDLIGTSDAWGADDGAIASVDFQKDVLPILQQNCIACHNRSKAESGVVLETADTIRAGGDSGPLVEAGKGSASRLIEVASHASEPVMPPEDNKVGAKKLDERQLKLIASWIDQGAQGSVNAVQKISWRAVPQQVHPVYSVAIDRSASWVAGSHGNRATIYSLIDGRPISELVDPAVTAQLGPQATPAADLDFVQSLVFSPDGKWVASGGYRTVKLWRRDDPSLSWWPGNPAGQVTAATMAADGQSMLVGYADGRVERRRGLSADPAATSTLRSADGRAVAAIATISADAALVVIDSGAQYQVLRGDQWQPVFVGSSVGSVASVVVGPGGRALVVTSDQRLHGVQLTDQGSSWTLTDRADGLPEGSTNAVQVLKTPQDQLLIMAPDGQARLYDWAQPAPLRSFAHGEQLSGATVSADGQRLVTWGGPAGAKLWNLADGAQVAELKGDISLQTAAKLAALQADVAAERVANAKSDLDEVQKQVTEADTNRKKAVEDRDKLQADLKAKAEEVAKLQAEHTAVTAQVAQQEQAITAGQQQLDATAAQLTQLAATIAELQPKTQAPADQADPRQQLVQEIQQKFKSLAEIAPQDSTVQLLQRETERLSGQYQREQEAKLAVIKQAVDQLQSVQAQQQKLTTDRDQAAQALEKQKADLAALKTQVEAKQKAVTDATAQQADLDKKQTVAAQEIERTEKLWTETQAQVAPATERVTAQEQQLAAAQQSKQASETKVAAPAANVVAAGFWGAERVLVWVAAPEGPQLRAFAVANGGPLMSFPLPADTASVNPSPGSNSGPSAGAKSPLIVWSDQIVVAGPQGLGTLPVYPRWSLAQTWGQAEGDSPFADRVTSLDFSPDSQLLAVGGGEPSRSGQLQIWNVAEGKLVRDIKDAHSDTVLSVAFSPDGKLLASGGTDRFARVFNVEDGAVKNAFEGHTHHVLSVAWQLNGRRLITGSADKTVKVWDVVKGEQVKTIEGFGMDVTRVQFVGAGGQFLAACGDKSLSLCNIDGSRNVIRQLDDYVYSADVVPASDNIVAGSHSGTIVVIGTDGKDRRQLP